MGVRGAGYIPEGPVWIDGVMPHRRLCEDGVMPHLRGGVSSFC